MSKDNLPSIDQFVTCDNLPNLEEFLLDESDQELPSIDQFIEHNNLIDAEEFLSDRSNEELPSIEDFIEEENNDEEEIPELIEEFALEEKSLEINEILQLINDVRENIPNIPEIKYYDDELEDICESIQLLAHSISEIKYCDSDIKKLEENIEEVRSEISIFPKWIIEVEEFPDFSWIKKSLELFDEDFVEIKDKIETIREKIEFDINKIVEENDVKFFENKIDLETKINKQNEEYQESTNTIWEKLKESSVKIWEYHKEFKDDDKKLKKQITNEYNSLKNNLEEKIKEFNENSVKTDQLLLNYFDTLKEEISNFPKVKYYDEDIQNVNDRIEKLDGRLSSFDDLYQIVEAIKLNQKDLEDQLSNKSLSLNEEDPLTPLSQNFATLEDLSSHYRLFINRIQQQLSTIGGGGETRLEFLDDVDRNSAKINGYVLQYDSSVGKFIGTSHASGGGDSFWTQSNAGIYTTSNVAIGTDVVSTGSTTLWVQGDARITGIVTASTFISDGDINSLGEVTSLGGVHILSAKKNFDIPHPTKDGWRLRHTCPEGPSNDVYFRGRVKNRLEIELPEYWKGLVDSSTVTVSLTPIGAHQDVIVKRISDNKVFLQSKGGMPIDCYYHIFAERRDGERLIPEYFGESPSDYPGNNEEYSISGYHYDTKEN